jgi:hypothetical protein
MVSVDIDSAQVVMFENKIGGDIGYEPAPEFPSVARLKQAAPYRWLNGPL